MREDKNAQLSDTDSKVFREKYTKSILRLCTAAILLAVAVNLFMSQIPVRFTRFDTTDVLLYSISDFTKQIMTGLDEEVDIYLVSQYGQEDNIVRELLSRYADLSGKIEVQQIDPVLRPDFLAQYSQSLEVNSVIVAGENRVRILSPAKFYVGDGGEAGSSYFAGEQEITGAISFVTSDYSPKLYQLTGHGEAPLPEYIEEAIARENIDIQPLNLGTLSAVPTDVDMLLLHAPQRDLSRPEADMIIEYLKNAGRMILIGGGNLPQNSPNLDAIASYYGITRVEGTVVERNSNYYAAPYPTDILAGIGTHPITSPLINRGYFVLSPMGQGLVPTGSGRSGIKSTPLLFTSDSAMSVSTVSADGEIEILAQGPFTVGLSVEEAQGNKDTRLVWFTSPFLLAEESNAQSSGANEDLFLNSLNWLCDFDEGISIRSKTLMMEYLSIRSTAGTAMGAAMIFVIPSAMLIAGGILLMRRRRR